MQEYIQVFGEKLGVLERISDRIWKEQYGKLHVCVHRRRLLFYYNFSLYSDSKHSCKTTK